MLARALKGLRRRLGGGGPRFSSELSFREEHYQRHNARRLEHLATLGLPVFGRRVLEVGAGIGDHTQFYLDRGCEVTSSDGRPENVDVLKRRFGAGQAFLMDLDLPMPPDVGTWDVVHCYGLLYHLSNPALAIRSLGQICSDLLLLETCVSPGDHEALNPVQENRDHPTQAVSGVGCRPTRPWVFSRLRESFPHVYCTRTQPSLSEFPLDWTNVRVDAGLTRAVFVASKKPVASDRLTDTIPDRQTMA